MKSRLLTALLACCLTTLAIGGAAPESAVETKKPQLWDFSFALDTAYRRDDFRWNIAGDTSGLHPNVLSELAWTDMNIILTGGTAEFTVFDHWHLRLGGAYGWIVSGNNRDSDYLLNDRQGEYSRSTAGTHGTVVEAEAMIGYDIKALHGRVTLTPQLGFVFHHQELFDRVGVQEIDLQDGTHGAFPGLDSEYETKWSGLAAGLDMRIQLSEKWSLNTGFRYERLHYFAEAEWNLRPDLDGFTHRATGNGWQFHAGVDWDFRPGWTLGLTAFYSTTKAQRGVDNTQFTDGTYVATRLNEVNWRTLGVQAALTRRF